jgi:hypothetical protein
VPYAYPHLACVPTVHPDHDNGDVHAFRTDVTGEIHDIGENDSYCLEPVDWSFNGWTPPLAGLSLDYGHYVVGIALNYPWHHGHSTLLRIYRRGYELTEVRAWDVPGHIAMQPASSVEAREKAIDRLVGQPTIEAPRAEFGYGHGEGYLLHELDFKGLKPGSDSPEHRGALLFAASEYEALAAAVETNQTMKDRLLNKAKDLRKLAAE